MNLPEPHIPKYGYKNDDVSPKQLNYRLVDRKPSVALRTVLQHFSALPAGACVLDLGCGDGSLEYAAGKDRSYSFTAIDIEPGAIRSIRNILNSQGHTSDLIIQGDITQLSAIRETNKLFDAAVSWRVIHGLSPDKHAATIRQVRDRLKPGASFFVAAASDQDWKVAALGEAYKPHVINDCADIMFRQFGIARSNPFPSCFFAADELEALGRTQGLEVVRSFLFDEPSGYEHLQNKPNAYVFIEFRVA